jgi:hypothetical protein
MAKKQRGKTITLSQKRSKGPTRKGKDTLSQSGSRKRKSFDGSDDNADSSSDTQSCSLCQQRQEHLEHKKTKCAEPELVDVEESDTAEDSNDDEVCQCPHQALNRTLTYCETGWKRS